MDIWSKEKRTEVMSKIRSKNTKPELLLRKYLFSKGLRYRINYKKLPGKPDIVFPKYKTVVFVNGCFWHGHDNCKIAHIPKSNVEFWTNKINNNKKRDEDNLKSLLLLGWCVFIVWECEINKFNLENLYEKIKKSISLMLIISYQFR
ncbi:DNA mismatch endonuclease Vsr [Chryseobacterium camelliae]|uniref:Very short patch repair endonuclease n=1 Tax=Chryseobacterium camelliae TaxID=1265445 RepID=A0ABY7QJN6_9FLAO|nr:DNA mismatch endonuclease Vsr [Chryseobacterium camelliae]WBV59895.1 DNA mismatch endonuclease Vsr [Chryseobacterium camelliae]